jgi:DNA-binding IclR family transcriptional regulator
VLALAGPRSSSATSRNRACAGSPPHTITDPDALRDELARQRRRGYAVEREEFDDDFCCIAAPVRDGARRFLARVGISMTRRASTRARGLARRSSTSPRGRREPATWRANALRDPARPAFQPSAETQAFLIRAVPHA